MDSDDERGFLFFFLSLSFFSLERKEGGCYVRVLGGEMEWKAKDRGCGRDILLPSQYSR